MKRTDWMNFTVYGWQHRCQFTHSGQPVNFERWWPSGYWYPVSAHDDLIELAKKHRTLVTMTKEQHGRST